MLLSKILKNVDLYDTDIPRVNVEKITAKLEFVDKNTLFILLKKEKNDIEKIIKSLTKSEPAAIVTEAELVLNETIPVIRVKNARKAYAMATYNLFEIDKHSTEFYAITGTNGKTSTATMLYKIFKDARIKSGFIGTGKIIIDGELVSDEFYSMTTPDPEELYPTIKRMQDAGCRKIVMEVSSHSLYLYKTLPLRFKCSAFTNLSAEHLDFHKNIESYYKAKFSIFNQSENGIFNMDDEYSKRAMLESCDNGNINVYSVGVKNSAEAMAKEVSYRGLNGSSYIYEDERNLFKTELSLCGEYNVSNSLIAIKCALISGIRPQIIQESLSSLKSIDGRMELVINEPTVIIDYAHTPLALQKVLFFIKKLKKEGQNIITVFGCGGERDTEKRPKMANISEKFSDYSIITSDNSRGESTEKIINEIIVGFSKKAKYKVIEDRKSAIKEAILKANENDVVLIVGKGHERYYIDQNGYHRFDERAIIFEAQSERLMFYENKNRKNANT